MAVIGLADVADSLSAIESYVYQGQQQPSPGSEGRFRTLLDALRADFQGEDDAALLAWLRNGERSPKYGNESPIADGHAASIVRLMDEMYAPRENYRGGRYRVGYYSMTNHAGSGPAARSPPQRAPCERALQAG